MSELPNFHARKISNFTPRKILLSPIGSQVFLGAKSGPFVAVVAVLQLFESFAHP
jgi:hypothetical protein